MAKQEKQEKQEKVGGVLVAKVNADILAKGMEAQGLKPGKDHKKNIKALADHFTENGSAQEEGSPHELMECDECGAPGFAELDVCPFCWEGGAESSSSPVPSALAGGGGTPAPLAKTSGTPSSAIQTTAKLDEAVAEVIRLKGAAATGFHQLGLKLKELFDSGLWKTRTDDAGKMKYKSFDAFAHHELQINANQAYSLMDMARNYSPEQVAVLGRSKIRLLMQVGPEDRKELEAKVAKDGTSKRELEKEVRKIKKEKGHRNPNRATGSTTQGKGGGRKPAEEKITVASVLGKQTVKLFKKPTGSKFDWKDLPRAKRFADKPFGREELPNGIVVYYTLTENAAGEWGLEVKRVREEPAKDAE